MTKTFKIEKKMQGRETYMMPGNLHLRTESHKEENEVEMIFILNIDATVYKIQLSVDDFGD